jgi:2-iminobutanoate/2-iminopropanoate deaminase
MTEQAHVICNNISAILEAAGSSLESVVKVNVWFNSFHYPMVTSMSTWCIANSSQVFVTDFALLAEFNAVYNTFFPQKPPRTSVEVSRLPLDVSIEVDVTAII